VIGNRKVLFAFRLIVGGAFVYAGVLKAADAQRFAQDILNFRVVGPELAVLTALFLPWLEIVCGAFLILGWLRRASSLLISVMLAGFIGLVIVTIARGLDVDCGCFGALSGQADWKLVVQDLVLLFMSLNILLAPRKTPGRNPAA